MRNTANIPSASTMSAASVPGSAHGAPSRRIASTQSNHVLAILERLLEHPEAIRVAIGRTGLPEYWHVAAVDEVGIVLVDSQHRRIRRIIPLTNIAEVRVLPREDPAAHEVAGEAAEDITLYLAS